MDYARIKSGIRWLLDHWYIPFTILGACLSYILLRRGPTPTERVQVEMDAVAAKRQVTQLALERGAQAAHDHVAQVYAEKAATLTEEHRREADALQQDPPALAAYLVRLGARLAAADDRGSPSPAEPPSAPKSPPSGS